MICILLTVMTNGRSRLGRRPSQAVLERGFRLGEALEGAPLREGAASVWSFARGASPPTRAARDPAPLAREAPKRFNSVTRRRRVSPASAAVHRFSQRREEPTRASCCCSRLYGMRL